jgi:hypothetical protein
MSFWTDLRDTIREVLLLRERLERVIAEVDQLKAKSLDYDRRLTRIEAFFEFAQSRRLPPSH